MRYADKSFIHVAVNSLSSKKWKLTAVYASPNASIKRALWGKLDKMSIEGA